MAYACKPSEILLRQAAMMLLGEGYEEEREEMEARRRSKKFSQSFKATSSWSLTRSRSSENANTEMDGKVRTTRRAISESPPNLSPMLSQRPALAPLVVEDPPSSDNASDLEDLRQGGQDPALLNGSSGNFGSAGPRSAPSTPQGLLGSSPGALTDALSQPSSPGFATPSIQRSPSHNLFGKYDKGTLKQLSCSTPAMTAQAQSPEPPSPKTSSSKDDKHTTSKARQKKFHRHFPLVDIDEKVLNHYSCALIGDILLQGQLYITSNYFAFYSNVFGYVTKLLIPLLSVEKITKEKTAKIIPNAIGIKTAEDKHVFGSLMTRDSTYRYMFDILERARNAQQLLEPPEIMPLEHNTDSDSSETREESGRESEMGFSKCVVKTKDIKPIDCIDKPILGIGKKDELRSSYFSKQRLLLFASTLLLILLFFSAAILLYRIGRIQQRYSLALQDHLSIPDNEDVYSEILNWQTHLHSKSAGAVHSFLDTNLDQIAKVRQSLEALSTLLTPNDSVSRNPQPVDDQSKES